MCSGAEGSRGPGDLGFEPTEAERRTQVQILSLRLLGRGTESFRTISGNPRQFNYRDESVGLCVSAQKYNNKNLFLISPDSCICFRKKAGQICVENQEHFVL